ncbi:UNKNOWN [Stylonychia lemnae]|uniref:Uncharacterized protein n=1 Tax=Stylonychia lemnae TaxID=5949 RepID=A0A078A5W8_STYLE|nr:UNKNOWN [Stylonychia lemnae]|eukprot:CDW76154.1 UNKNOWN [Stylonychia lemnae]
MEKQMIKTKGKVMADMRWLMREYMSDIGGEALSMGKVNFGIKMDQYNMMANGNVENLMVMAQYIINGDNKNLKENFLREEQKEESIGLIISMIDEKFCNDYMKLDISMIIDKIC